MLVRIESIFVENKLILGVGYTVLETLKTYTLLGYLVNEFMFLKIVIFVSHSQNLTNAILKV